VTSNVALGGQNFKQKKREPAILQVNFFISIVSPKSGFSLSILGF
jgi:hypothetical protein